MTWTLILYITGCVGPDCTIPDFGLVEYENEQACHEAMTTTLKPWLEADKNHTAFCYETESPPKKIEVWRLDDGRN